jgi:heme/copper-type cytochrome/quinol oxidase subunit 2
MITTKEILNIVLLISPIILIQVGMAVYALIDLRRRAKTRGPRWAWALGLIVTAFAIPSGIIVSGVYLAWGRHAEV